MSNELQPSSQTDFEEQVHYSRLMAPQGNQTESATSDEDPGGTFRANRYRRIQGQGKAASFLLQHRIPR
jgi:hypothetical protein